jgi:hypothetical protein
VLCDDQLKVPVAVDSANVVHTCPHSWTLLDLHAIIGLLLRHRPLISSKVQATWRPIKDGGVHALQDVQLMGSPERLNVSKPFLQTPELNMDAVPF